MARENRIAARRYRPYVRADLERIPQLAGLSRDQLLDMKSVSAVLPFRTNSYVVEELIRWDCPLQLFERWVLEDGVEVAGVPIPRGEVIAMLFGAANRDPRVFEDANRLDVSRANAAEHIGFGLAYLASAAASILLIAGYSRSVLRSSRRAGVMAALLAGLYGFLYLVLRAEDYALLAGAVGLWCILGTIMYLTRHIDWYRPRTGPAPR